MRRAGGTESREVNKAGLGDGRRVEVPSIQTIPWLCEDSMMKFGRENTAQGAKAQRKPQKTGEDGTQWIIKLIAHGHKMLQTGERVPDLRSIDIDQIFYQGLSLTDVIMGWSLQLVLHCSLTKKRSCAKSTRIHWAAPPLVQTFGAQIFDK